MAIDDEPSVLLIDANSSEGVCSTIAEAGRRYCSKSLRSNPENWTTICEAIESGAIELVLVRLSAHAYYRFLGDGWEDVGDRLLGSICKIPHAVFIHSDLFHAGGDAVDESTRSGVNELILQSKVSIIPYTKNSELTVVAQELIWRTMNGLVLRTYVPSGQLWSDETGRFLQLFRDYLGKVSKLEVRMNETRTSSGVVYELYSDTSHNLVNIDREIERFSELIDLCQTSITDAEAFLKSRSVSDVEITRIVERFAKEGKRLRVDLKHEYERKLLSIRHRLEAELSEFPSVSPEALSELVEAAVPVAINAILPGRIAKIQNVHTPPSHTFNINPQIVHAVQCIVAQEVNGDLSLSNQDREIIDLITAHAGDQQRELIAAIRELADSLSPKAAKLTAMGRLTAFLGAIGGKVTDGAVGALIAYLQQKLTGT